jgi:hypothetical protein
MGNIGIIIGYIVLHLQSAVSVDCLCSSRSPLHYAAANCNYQCLFALVGSGASVNDLDKRGCTPLHYAAASDTDGKYVSHSSYCCVCVLWCRDLSHFTVVWRVC